MDESESSLGEFKISRREFLKGLFVAGMSLGMSLGIPPIGQPEPAQANGEPQTGEAPSQKRAEFDLDNKEPQVYAEDLELIADFGTLPSTWIELTDAILGSARANQAEILTTGSNQEIRDEILAKIQSQLAGEKSGDDADVRLDICRVGEKYLLREEGNSSVCVISPDTTASKAALSLKKRRLLSLTEEEEPQDSQQSAAKEWEGLKGIDFENIKHIAALQRDLANPRGVLRREGAAEYIRQKLSSGQNKGESESKNEGNIIGLQIFAGESPHFGAGDVIVSTMNIIAGRGARRPETVYSGIFNGEKEVRKAPQGIEFYNAHKINIAGAQDLPEAYVVEADNRGSEAVSDGENTFPKGTSTWLLTYRKVDGAAAEEWIRLDRKGSEEKTKLYPAKVFVVESGEKGNSVVLLETKDERGKGIVKAITIGAGNDGKIITEEIEIGEVENNSLPQGGLAGGFVQEEKGEKKLVVYRAVNLQGGESHAQRGESDFFDRSTDIQRGEVVFADGKIVGEKTKKLESIVKRPLPNSEPIGGIKVSEDNGNLLFCAAIDSVDLEDPRLALFEDSGATVSSQVVVSREALIQGVMTQEDKLFLLETAGYGSQRGEFGFVSARLCKLP